MDLYIEHNDNSYLDSHTSGQLFKSSKKLNEDIPFKVFKKSTIKPLRGLGRYKPNFEEISRHTEKFQYKYPVPLKGFGKNNNYYLNLNLWFKNHVTNLASQNKKSYIYWRGFGKPSTTSNH